MIAYPPALVEAYREGLRTRRVQNFPDWADENILLRRQGKLVPWRTSLTPYLREIMMLLSADSPVEEIVIIKPSQWGGSEMANAFCAYVIANCATPMLFFQPDIEAAKRYMLERLRPVLMDCPALRGLLVEPKSRDPGSTLQTQGFFGGTLDLLGGNSPAGFSSKPAGVVIIDEWDRMAAGAGSGERAEGDQYELAKNRMITFVLWRKMLALSTPGNTSTSKVEPAYLASDRRRYFVPCPLCSRMILLEFERLWWPNADATARVVYRCQLCDNAFDERPKREMNAAGKWVAEMPQRSVAGFASNGLYSPWLKWREIAERWERAKGRPGKVRVFFNNVLGRTYDVHGETRVKPNELAPLRCKLQVVDGVVVVPRGVGLLTVGADLQHNRIEAVLYGWGRGEECWHLDQVIIPGDPSGDRIWEDFDSWLRRRWQTEDGGEMGISAAGVDTGYEANRVYQFVKTRGARGIWGVKGARSGEGRRVWPRRPSRSPTKVDFYLIGQDTAKAHIYARLRASVRSIAEGVERTRGMVHIGDHFGDDAYLEQLVSETPVTKTVHGHPRIVWDLPAHKRNEALDCAVYGYAALQGLKAKGRQADVRLESTTPRASHHPAPARLPSGISFRKKTAGSERNSPPRPEAKAAPRRAHGRAKRKRVGGFMGPD